MRYVFVFVLFAGCTGGSGTIAAPDGGASSSTSSSGSGSSSGSSTSSGGSGSSSGATTATPQVIATVHGGAAASCASVPTLTVGDFPDPQSGTSARPVKNGEEGVTISCTVAPTASGFTLSAMVSAGGTRLEVDGAVDANGNSSSDGRLDLSNSTATWRSGSCALETKGDAQFGVAAGRYWGLFSCQGTLIDGDAACDIFGQIRVENCRQSF